MPPEEMMAGGLLDSSAGRLQAQERRHIQYHPITRWSDVLAGFCATLPGTEGLWTDWAQSREGWAMLKDDFVAFSV